MSQKQIFDQNIIDKDINYKKKEKEKRFNSKILLNQV